MERLHIFQLEMQNLNRTKTIRVYLPIGYEENKEKNYPVLYMHDGQNLFDPHTAGYGVHWQVGETLDELQRAGYIEGYIVVGMDNNNDDEEGKRRFDEYSPWPNHDLMEIMDWEPPISKVAGGEGSEYVDFIVTVVKPYMDAHYRTKPEREYTTIAGSSMGGFISLFAGFQYPDVFSKVGAFSTAAWFGKEALFKHIRDNFRKGDLRIYLDVGTNEGNGRTDKDFNSIYLNDSIELFHLLKGLGQIEEDLLHVVEEEAKHHESAWARRFPQFIKWIQS